MKMESKSWNSALGSIYEHVCLHQMLVSCTVCCCPQASFSSVPGLPAVAMAVEARHRFSDCGKSAQGTNLEGISCVIMLTMPQLLAANLEEADPAVYEILQRVPYPPNDDRFPQQIAKGYSLMHEI